MRYIVEKDGRKIEFKTLREVKHAMMWFGLGRGLYKLTDTEKHVTYWSLNGCLTRID